MSWLYAAAKQQRGIRQLFGDFMSQHFNIKLGQDEQFFFLIVCSVEILEKLKYFLCWQSWNGEQLKHAALLVVYSHHCRRENA